MGPTINDKFPNLRGEASTTTEFDLYEYLEDKWGCIFMHPADFTPVCTTELGRAAVLQDEFTKRGVKLCGFSCSDASEHKEWLEDVKVATGGEVTFPLFCDPTRQHAVDLGVLDASNKDAKGLPLTVRSLFILKPDHTVALMMTYPATTGRNFDEILRVIDSLQLTVNHSLATPVDWKQGEDAIVNFPLSDEDADTKFGKGGYKTVELPSEMGKDLPKHYLRYTKVASKSKGCFPRFTK
eukprot:CAMPEP_0198296632 /NCGR_PEP_ID=MMETSP1449-20131203/33263_1 /TAXON_ID=420275 /ORGANISM="Attheya septentrionalis, Strain CCMP2084" /LENGTH=238 /DNA_ID=CAMNT_0043997297 /DNA_START=178 /DNA_END=894 /DNA_ORIENTATION=+